MNCYRRGKLLTPRFAPPALSSEENLFLSYLFLDQSVTNIFEYSNIFYPNIYSGIRSYHFSHTNIFGYSFVSTFWIRIYSDIRSWQDFDSNIFGYSFVSIFRTQTDSEDVLLIFSGYYPFLMDIL